MDSYGKLITKYAPAILVTGRLTREKDEFDGVEVEKGDLDRVRTRLSLKFNKNNDGISKKILELMNYHTHKCVKATTEALYK